MLRIFKTILVSIVAVFVSVIPALIGGWAVFGLIVSLPISGGIFMLYMIHDDEKHQNKD